MYTNMALELNDITSTFGRPELLSIGRSIPRTCLVGRTRGTGDETCSRGPRSADPADSRSLPLAVAVTTSPPCTRSPTPQVGTVQDTVRHYSRQWPLGPYL